MLLITCVAAFFSSDFDGARPFKAAFDTDLWTLAETSAFVFVAYAGVTKVAAIGGEVKDPEKNLPAGMLLSLLIATVLYAMIAYLMMAAIPGTWWEVDGKLSRIQSLFLQNMWQVLNLVSLQRLFLFLP